MKVLRQALRELRLDGPAGLATLVVGAALSSLFGLGFERIAMAAGGGTATTTVAREGIAAATVSACQQLPCRTKKLAEGEIVLHPHECLGDDGAREGVLKLAIFSNEYAWDFQSHDRVLINGTPVDFPGVLSSRGLRSLIESDEVIAVGTASCEGQPVAEECRALRRARRLKAWIRQVRERPGAESGIQPLHELNLGQYRGECRSRDGERTLSQRQVMLVAVDRVGEDVELEGCLAEALAESTDLRYLTESYSEFTLDPTPAEDPCSRTEAREG